ncbi:hypothetical protein GOODEAATRI_021823 [Goodea atripinnis]|uniref:Uncharacterized protein n=1 Tax=Goodea atripinnis TaxID=208336 RepID=A0ABV0NWN7_9TELE
MVHSLTSARRLLYQAFSKPWFLLGDLSALNTQSPFSSFTSLEEDSRGNSMPESDRSTESRAANSHKTRSILSFADFFVSWSNNTSGSIIELLFDQLSPGYGEFKGHKV